VREERIAKLKSLLEADPNDSFGRYALALEYAALNDTAQAQRLLEELISHDPAYVPAYQHLGYLHQKLGQRDDAISMFKRGIEVATQRGNLLAKSEMQEALDEIIN
jgi:Tfp pilus assembly protein PilF